MPGADPKPLDLNHLEPFKSERGYDYLLVSPIASGKNGSVFHVLAKGGKYDGQLFALKVLWNLSSKERRDRFHSEIKFLEGENYPGIAPLFDKGTFVSESIIYPFFVSRAYPNTLRAVLETRTSSFHEKLLYSIQLLGTLSFLSKRSSQVVHRDIKPENIFASGRTVILGDFGLSKTLQGASGSFDDSDKEVISESLEKPEIKHYRTPDLVDYVVKGIPITVQSDVFQLGLVLFELFHGVNPLQDSSETKGPVILEAELSMPLKGVFGQEVDGLLTRMLEMDPAIRISAEAALSMATGIYERSSKRIYDEIGEGM